MTFAAETTVSVEKSLAEVQTLLTRYGATKFAYAQEAGKAQVCFAILSKTAGEMPLWVRMTLPLPAHAEDQFVYHKKRKPWDMLKRRTPEDAHRAWEQACRSRWRSLVLVVKAKLDAVTVGISTLEREFLSDLVLPNGKTMGEEMIAQLPEMYARGKTPLLLAVDP